MISNESLRNDARMQKFPKITIGCCIKNCQRTIADCLQSLLSCDYEKTKMKIIVVDAKSTDNTLSIAIEILRGGGVRFDILSDLGRGLVYARQLVVENADSEYICWVDGDNILTRGFISTHVKFMQANPSVGMAIPLTLATSRKIVARLEMYNWLIPTLTALRKRKTPPDMMQGTITSVAAIKEVGGFSVLISGPGEDVDLIRRIRLRYRIAVNPQAKVYHVMRDSWREILKQMRWYSRIQPRRNALQVLLEVLSILFVKNKSFLAFFKYSNDPAGFLLPLFSIFQHMSYLVYYFSYD
jgi:glycosyltransferase involved in cell wall biosynthesis